MHKCLTCAEKWLSLMLLLSVMPFPSAASLLPSIQSIYTTPHNIHFHKHLGTCFPYSPKSSMAWLSFHITNKACSCEVLRYLNPNVNDASPLNAFYSYSQRPHASISLFVCIILNGLSLLHLLNSVCFWTSESDLSWSTLPFNWHTEQCFPSQ